MKVNCSKKHVALQSGFSLVEVMIALLVLSVGLLGLAALQTVSLKTGNESYLRTQATMLAYDIVDRMRANPGGVVAGNYDNVTDAPQSMTANCVKDSTACSASALAGYDIAFWKAELGVKLPQGKGEIDTNVSGSTTTGTVTVKWSENDLPMELELVVQL